MYVVDESTDDCSEHGAGLTLLDDGYRLTYGGLDYLALNAHRRSDVVFSLGNQIGVGKESDIYITASPNGRQQVLKLHRLGRISFRTVKANRDYLRKRSTGSWMYLSRLAAQKEHAFMQVLYREGFPVPEPLAWSRHTIVMEFIDSFPLRMIESVPDPGKLYAELLDMIVQLAQRGLIHGDFNEFNILIKEETKNDRIILRPILIDFPQTVSTNHSNAQFYFDRDVACVKRYFERKFKYTSDEPGPHFAESIRDADPAKRLDIEVEASGFSRKMGKELDRFIESTGGIQNEAEPNIPVDDGEAEEDKLDEDEDENEEEEEEGEEDDDDDEPGHQELSDIPSTSDKIVEKADAAKQAEAGATVLQNDHSEPQEDVQSRLVEPLEKLSTQDNTSNPHHPAAFGLQPFDLPQDPDAVSQKVRSKKKATGWAI
jgi:RIO kinase 2